MMANGLFVPAAQERASRVSTAPRPRRLSSAVGGWHDSVDLPGLGAPLHLNEEGRLRGPPFNSRASFLWWYQTPWALMKEILVGEPCTECENLLVLDRKVVLQKFGSA